MLGSAPIWVVLAAALGLLVGTLSSWWIARLRRGADVSAVWLGVVTAVVSGVGVALADSRLWPLVLWVGWLGVVLSAIDLKHHRLPDAITLPAIPVTLLVVAVSPLSTFGSTGWWRAVLGGLVLGAVFLLFALLAPGGMGRGDAKLAVSVGVALGSLSWPHMLLGVFLGFLLGALAGLVGILSRRWTLRTAIPFGPALLLGAWLVLAVPAVSRLVSAT